MRIFANSVVFDYPWHEVSTAMWRKYCSWNDKATHVIAVDTISSTVDSATGILRTERLITCRQRPPDWLRALIGAPEGNVSHIYEACYVDPAGHTVTSVSQNLTWRHLVNCQEKVVYRPQGPNHTCFEQSARITALCGGWQRIKNAIEDGLVRKFGENAAKGREGFETVLAMSRRMLQEELDSRPAAGPVNIPAHQ